MTRTASTPPYLLAAAGIQASDQMAIAALPLVAALALSASAERIGMLLAAQGAAWLLLSLPAGLLVDRWSPRRAVILAAALAVAGLGVATLAIAAGSAVVVGLAVFAASAGTAGFTIALQAAVAAVVDPPRLAAMNARLEFARGAAAIGAPLAAGVLVAAAPAGTPFALAGAAALVGLAACLRLPAAPAAPTDRAARLDTMLLAGARFVMREPVLRAIAGCAVAWNFAFFTLNAAFVPHAMQRHGWDAGTIGFVVSGFGVGMVAATAVAAALFRRVAPAVVLVAGPALSLVGMAAILLADGPHAVAVAVLGFSVLGFGPMLWAIMQVSLRQTVTPPPLMGRVGATLQVLTYGVRPIGALAGGLVAGSLSPRAALILALLGFGASLAVALLSPLARLRRFPPRAVVPAHSQHPPAAVLADP